MLDINHQDFTDIKNYLISKGLLVQDENIIKIESPGAGNMNMVLRLITNQKSLILKQSKPYVQKYPQISAPANRIESEIMFYNEISSNSKLQNYSPKILFKDASNNLLVMEDLGDNSDFVNLYDQQMIEQDQCVLLMEYLEELHSLEIKKFTQNLEMRKLNHHHIFIFPFDIHNGFNLDLIQDGLHDASMKFKSKDLLKKVIESMGQKYLNNDGGVLIHGDFYPGSWLQTSSGLKVIDPEFCFLGPKEFDLGVFSAHMTLAKQHIDFNFIYNCYKINFDHKMMRAFCGIEIMRRLLGVAQLPLKLSLAEKVDLLHEAEKMILNV